MELATEHTRTRNLTVRSVLPKELKIEALRDAYVVCLHASLACFLHGALACLSLAAYVYLGD